MFMDIDEDEYTRPCTLKSAFHDTSKCCLVVKGSSTYHRYTSLEVSRNKNCKLFVDLIDDDEYEYIGDINGRIQLDLKLPSNRNYIDIVEYGSSSVDNFKNIITNILEVYFTTYKPAINNYDDKINSQKYNYDFDRTSLFDVGIFEGYENVIKFFRPVKFIHEGIYSHTPMTRNEKFIEFYANFRELLFLMIDRFTDKNYINRVTKEAKSCSLKNWTSFPDFKCNNIDKSTCSSYNKVFIDGEVSPKLPSVMCTHIIDELLDRYPNTCDNFVHFNCRFSAISMHRETGHNPINSIIQISQKRFPIHRLCIHKNYLTEKWFKWVIEEVLALKVGVLNA